MEPTQTGLAIPLDAGFLSCHRCVKCVISRNFRWLLAALCMYVQGGFVRRRQNGHERRGCRVNS